MIKLNIKSDTFVVVTSEPLSEYKRKIFDDFYSPIVGVMASSLYNSFFTVLEFGKTESNPIKHEVLCKKLKLTEEAFLEARRSLEAIGLLDTYVKSTPYEVQYLYVVKNVLTPYQFLTNSMYSNLLNVALGEEGYMNIIGEYMVHRYNVVEFENITSSFDEVFEVGYYKSNDESWWINDTPQNITIKAKHFDYDYFLVLVGASNLVSDEVLRSSELYHEINQLAFVFMLTAEELKEVVLSASNGQTVDFDMLRHYARRAYEDKNKGIAIKHKKNVIVSTNDKLVTALETLSPAEIIKNKYGTAPTGSEIEMFNRLLNDTGVSVGVLNALILYVLSNKNGEIPSYNYFLKILNTWIRQNVKTTLDALEIINNPPKTKARSSKNVKETASWYEEYQKQVDESLKNEQSANKKQASMEELESFFKK
ncbi:MAG: DnaD domain protein [Bacilli bacterium]|nr:DnaD domain protein [Bacilli bacterium]